MDFSKSSFLLTDAIVACLLDMMSTKFFDFYFFY